MLKLRVSRLVACLATAILLSAAWSWAAAQPPQFRLPGVARPTRYQLELTIVPSEPTFKGTATVSIDLTQRTDVVWLNAKDLTIEQVKVNVDGGPKSARWKGSAEFLGIDLPHSMGPGPLQLEIRYRGKLDNKSSAGAYRKRAGDDWYVYTSFMPIDARRAFPCFDEPGYKAPWELTLHVRRDQVAVANAPGVSESEEPDGMKRVVFAPTQPLASEVVAFAVGPFEIVEAGVAGQKRIPVRIITPRGRAREAAAARGASAEIVPRLEQYTGIPYPWDKLDHIAVLDLPFGATENPGLITYLDRELLAPPERDTPERQRSMRETMAHELAHQWFGNLVTQAWWDDTWLSEGFATWLGTKVSDLELPPFERGLAITETRDRMIAADSPEARPVRLEVHSRKEMDDVYDPFIYYKGAAILEMLEDWLGPEKLQHSLHRYLTDHQFGNASSSDLAQAMKQETRVDAGPVLFSFLDRPGSPVLRFSLASTDASAKLEIEQGNGPWTAPVCFHAENENRRCEVVNSSHAEISLPRTPDWIWPNAYGSGYYRSLLTPALINALIRGYSELTEPERLALAGDLEDLTQSGEARAADVMRILPGMARDREACVADRATAIALELALASTDAVRGKYATWLKRAIGLSPASPEQAGSIEEFLREKH
jgi:cytosol alanyl aminopeptidase